MQRITTLSPLLNRCLIQKIIPKQISKGGIILPDKATEKEARLGKVIAVGPGERTEKGEIMKPYVKIGDIVLLPEYQGAKVPMADTESEYLIYKDTELLGIIEGFKH